MEGLITCLFSWFGNWRCDQECSVTFQGVGVGVAEVMVDLPVNTRGPSWCPSTGRLGSELTPRSQHAAAHKGEEGRSFKAGLLRLWGVMREVRIRVNRIQCCERRAESPFQGILSSN